MVNFYYKEIVIKKTQKTKNTHTHKFNAFDVKQKRNSNINETVLIQNKIKKSFFTLEIIIY